MDAIFLAYQTGQYSVEGHAQGVAHAALGDLLRSMHMATLKVPVPPLTQEVKYALKFYAGK